MEVYRPASLLPQIYTQTPPRPGMPVQEVEPGKETSFSKESSCETCENRKYQDGSDDPSVSFQTPTKLSPGQASSMVRSHEYEHVRNEKASAHREGREVIYQSVVIHGSICPDCGKPYVSGGETKTVTKGSIHPEDLKGQVLDEYV